MPFGLAGFMEVDQLKSGSYRVQAYARNGQLLSSNMASLPEAAAANAIYVTDTEQHYPPPLLLAPPAGTWR